MKFGETFTEYLHGDQEALLNRWSHAEYKRLKKVLKRCRVCRESSSVERLPPPHPLQEEDQVEEEEKHSPVRICRCDSCPSCDQMFFTELTKEASEIAGCFSSRVRRLLNLHHFSSGLTRYMWSLRCCFMDDQQLMIQEGRVLLDYLTMNAYAIRKILKKYDKIHGSVNGRNFKINMGSKHIELLQSPWLIELGAFHLNVDISNYGEPSKDFQKITCNLSDTEPVITMTTSNSVIYEYSLTCAICLETVFNPYALSCGHIFCKGCACSAASVLLFQGLKEASREAKCPVCRAADVYGKSIHMEELDLLLKNRCKDYCWKERLREEREEMVKQSKEFWESQTAAAFGI